MVRLTTTRHRLPITILALMILLSPVVRAQDARHNTPPARALSIDNTVSTMLNVGTSLLSPVTRTVQGDPYYQFRNARYSNEGLINERDEIELGRRLHTEISRRYQLTSTGQARASRTGQRVAAASRRPNLTYRFYVVRSNEINAFSIPGGYIYVTTGLLNLANDEELASVLSHEVAHIVARHSLKTYQQSQFFGGIADLVGSIAGGIAGEQAGGLANAAARIAASPLLAAHNREEEREADFLGVRAMSGAGFDPQAMISMFEKLQRQSQSNRDILGSIFNNHPDTAERIENTRYEVNRMRRR